MVSSQDCIFCKIVRGEAPSRKIHEDSDVIAFLDINPASIGHTLIIPKKHFENIYDIEPASLEKVIVAAKAISERAKAKLGAEGVNVLQSNGRHAGQLVDHLHVHVIPRYTNDNIMIRFPRAQLTDEDMKQIQDKLKDEEKKSYDSGSQWI